MLATIQTSPVVFFADLIQRLIALCFEFMVYIVKNEIKFFILIKSNMETIITAQANTLEPRLLQESGDANSLGDYLEVDIENPYGEVKHIGLVSELYVKHISNVLTMHSITIIDQLRSSKNYIDNEDKENGDLSTFPFSKYLSMDEALSETKVKKKKITFSRNSKLSIGFLVSEAVWAAITLGDSILDESEINNIDEVEIIDMINTDEDTILYAIQNSIPPENERSPELEKLINDVFTKSLKCRNENLGDAFSFSDPIFNVSRYVAEIVSVYLKEIVTGFIYQAYCKKAAQININFMKISILTMAKHSARGPIINSKWFPNMEDFVKISLYNEKAERIRLKTIKDNLPVVDTPELNLDTESEAYEKKSKTPKKKTKAPKKKEKKVEESDEESDDAPTKRKVNSKKKGKI
jgi:hypothetical protein